MGVSDGADAALRHALQDPENVEVLVLVSPSAIRPANAAGDANDDAAELEARLAHVQCPTLVVFGQEDVTVQSCGDLLIIRPLVEGQPSTELP